VAIAYFGRFVFTNLVKKVRHVLTSCLLCVFVFVKNHIFNMFVYVSF